MIRGVQFPSFSLVPKSVRCDWQDVRDLCAAYGLVLDEWQENACRATLGERQDGTWAAARVGLSVPRQSGKTALFEARELAGLLLFGEELILHSAHLVPTALEGFQRIKGYFENYDDLRRRVRRVREANGEQGIEMRSGQRLRFMARSKSSGRGFSADLLLLDEAQELSDQTWAAILPTLSARPNPQAWLAGTPPAPEANGEVFTRLREAAHKGKDPRLCWLEWSCEPGADLDDRRNWARANPGLGVRIGGHALVGERAAMDDETFARERLGVWFDPESSASVLDVAAWRSWVDRSPGWSDLVAFGVTVSPDRKRAVVGVAGFRADGLVQVEVVAEGPGTAWLPDWLAQRASRWAPSAVVLDGLAASLEFPLVERGVPVVLTSTRDRAQGTVGFFDRLSAGGVRHPGEPLLDAAVAHAGKRVLTDGWVWDGPLVGALQAVTLAHMGLVEAGQRAGVPAPAPLNASTAGAYETSDLVNAGF